MSFPSRLAGEIYIFFYLTLGFLPYYISKKREIKILGGVIFFKTDLMGCNFFSANSEWE